MGTEQQVADTGYHNASILVNTRLLAEAEKLKVNIARAVEQGLKQALKQRREAVWLENNLAALESSNAFVEQHGLPLAKYRRF